jgi:RNA polymerase sigma-70 factor, ECF subfamily
MEPSNFNSQSPSASRAISMSLPRFAQDLPAHDSANHEQTLIRQIVTGDTASFAELIAPHRATMFAATLPILDNKHEDAEECVQEALLKALTNLTSFRGTSRFGTWLTQISINEALMRRRRYRRSRYDSIDELLTDHDGEAYTSELPDHRSGPAQGVELNMLRQAVAHAFAKLMRCTVTCSNCVSSAG